MWCFFRSNTGSRDDDSRPLRGQLTSCGHLARRMSQSRTRSQRERRIVTSNGDRIRGISIDIDSGRAITSYRRPLPNRGGAARPEDFPAMFWDTRRRPRTPRLTPAQAPLGTFGFRECRLSRGAQTDYTRRKASAKRRRDRPQGANYRYVFRWCGPVRATSASWRFGDDPNNRVRYQKEPVNNTVTSSAEMCSTCAGE